VVEQSLANTGVLPQLSQIGSFQASLSSKFEFFFVFSGWVGLHRRSYGSPLCQFSYGVTPGISTSASCLVYK
jgi:hypothetical protein